jgi:hypothetical protein
MRGFLLLAESHEVVNELDPHFKNLILSQAIKRPEEQFGHFASLLKLILQGWWGDYIDWTDAPQLSIDFVSMDCLVKICDGFLEQIVL